MQSILKRIVLGVLASSSALFAQEQATPQVIPATPITAQVLELTVPTPPTMQEPKKEQMPGTPLEAEQVAPQNTPEIPQTPLAQEVPIQAISQPAMSQAPMAITPSTEPTHEPVITSASEINIGLSSDILQKSADLLNALLSDEYVLYTKTLKFHWNVKGIVFHDFHTLFKEQYEALFEYVDSIAERARALGQPALGSLSEFSNRAKLKDVSADNLSPEQMIAQLLQDHEAIIRTIRAAIDETAKLGDQGTSNFLQDLIVKHEKLAWMLRATVNK